MLKVNVNQIKEVVVEQNAQDFVLDGVRFEGNISRISETEFHILKNGKAFHVRVIKKEGNETQLLVNGKYYTTTIKDKQQLLLEEMGIQLKSSDQAEDIKAPMPGLVLKLLIEPGMEVEKNTPLLILEAMKMENVIKSPGKGIVHHIKVKEKDAVEKGQILVTFK
jgi:biotin carboxyl carrier protein